MTEKSESKKAWKVRAGLELYDLDEVLNELSSSGYSVFKVDEVSFGASAGSFYVIAYDPIAMTSALQATSTEAVKKQIAEMLAGLQTQQGAAKP